MTGIVKPPIPPTHACPSCGAKHPTAEAKAVYDELLTEHVYKCAHCKELCAENYRVTDAVWAASGLPHFGGSLHLACLEKLISRQLTLADFEDVPMNSMIRYFWKRIQVASTTAAS